MIENKGKIVGCKWDTLTKYVGHRIVVLKVGMKKGGEYNTKYGAKLKNIKLYAQRGQIQFWPK